MSSPSWNSLPAPVSPFLVITEHQACLPVWYSTFSLVIYFTHDGVYMSTLLSQFIPPPIPRCVHKSILYIRVSISSQQIGSSVPFFLGFMCITCTIFWCSGLKPLTRTFTQLVPPEVPVEKERTPMASLTLPFLSCQGGWPRIIPSSIPSYWASTTCQTGS